MVGVAREEGEGGGGEGDTDVGGGTERGGGERCDGREVQNLRSIG